MPSNCLGRREAPEPGSRGFTPHDGFCKGQKAGRMDARPPRELRPAGLGSFDAIKRHLTPRSIGAGLEIAGAGISLVRIAQIKAAATRQMHIAAARRLAEIGRASCRGRVEISVVAV